MFSDMHEEWEHRLVEKTKKEIAKEIWDKASFKAYNKNENPLKREIYVIDMEDLRDIVNEVGLK